MIYLTGPGHGGPALVALATSRGPTRRSIPRSRRTWRDAAACAASSRLPAGSRATSACTTPGSIHEGGELGYVLAHAFGAAFDNPDLIVAAVVGDGEAETGPLAGAWKGTSFLNPARDGAVLPILHLNGYKISGPTVLGRASDDDVGALLAGQRLRGALRRGRRSRARAPGARRDARPLLRAHSRDPASRRASTASSSARRWPAIVLRTPKGWTGPKVVDGLPVEGTFRAHQVPLADVRDGPEQFAQLEEWMRSYRPDELFDADGRFVAELAALAPAGERRMSANPHANGGKLLIDLELPDFRDYALDVDASRRRTPRVHAPARQDAARHLRAQRRDAQLPAVLPRRDQLEPPGQRLRGRESLLRRPDARRRRSSVARTVA